MPCEFIVQLSKLRKLSAESVDNTTSFAAYKEYLHVERPVEIELREVLREVNACQGKCLLLLCGSAGDGKSHLISYLKNADLEGLLYDFETYNDATESSEPQLTSMDTLAARLSAFNDDNYQIEDGKKMIVAINLGTLNNFVDSEQGNKYRVLRDYVMNSGIFSGYIKNGYENGSVFQHVSFSDYQVFALTADGVETSFLNALIGKIFSQSENNPFYQAYMGCQSCTVRNRCPVCHNYQFLSEQRNQKVIIRRIVEAVMIDKAIVSTRDILNLIYDLIVHPDFNEEAIRISPSDVAFLTTYIKWTTPMLLNEYSDISGLLNAIQNHSTLKERCAELDSKAIRFHSMENISEEFCNASKDTPFKILNSLTDISVLGGMKPELKKLTYRFIEHLREFSAEPAGTRTHRRLQEYMQYLYFQNSGNETQLAKLYDSTLRAVMNWNGQFSEDYICIDDTNDFFWILEQLYLEPVLHKKEKVVEGPLQRFSPVLKLRFRKADSSSGDTVELSVDFSLFELILDMRDGYRPTVQDKNQHADFVSFVQQLIKFGNKSTRVTLVPKSGNRNSKIVFEKSPFGYKFKVALS